MAYLWNPEKDKAARNKGNKSAGVSTPASRSVDAKTGKVSTDPGGVGRVHDGSKRKTKTRGMIKHSRRR